MNYTDFLEHYSYDNRVIRLRSYYDNLIIVPLVIGVCVSLPALIWAVHVLYTLRKQGGRISAFVILLIINDLVELLLSAVIASCVTDSLVWSNATSCEYYVIYLFITFRIVGLYIHQLVALESMLYRPNQQCSAHVFSPLYSTIICVILWLFFFGYQFLGSWINLVFCSLSLYILVITCVQSHTISVAPDRINPGSAVLIVSTLTVITFFATSVLAQVINIASVKFYTHISEFLAFVISLRVTSDPVLCVLVSKHQLRVYKQQAHTELNADQVSVNV